MTDVSHDAAERIRAPVATAPLGSVALDRLLRWPEVQPLVGGVSRVTWWRMIRAGDAPKGIQISPNCVAWRSSDIAAFQARRAALSEAA